MELTHPKESSHIPNAAGFHKEEKSPGQQQPLGSTLWSTQQKFEQVVKCVLLIWWAIGQVVTLGEGYL